MANGKLLLETARLVLLGFCLNLFLWCGNGQADIIRLKNGRSLEGIVTKETDTEVVLDLGVGTMTIARSTIAGIEYADEEGRAKLVEEWRRRYYFHSRYVPAGMEPLLEALRTVESKREVALRANQTVQLEESAARKIRETMIVHQKRLAQLSLDVQRVSPDIDAAAYNDLVRKVNAVQAELIVKQHELEAAEERRKKAMHTVTEYMHALTSFEGRFREAAQIRAAEKGDAPVIYFLGKIGERLRELRKDIQETAQPAREHGGTTVVTAVVNGTQQGEFILDTGAGLVSMNESFAQRAGVDLDGAPETDLVMADGRRVRGKAVVLRSVQVGDAVVYHVPAVVMPMTLRGSVDGLLGMSFLQHFDVSMSPGMVTLRNFKPK